MRYRSKRAGDVVPIAANAAAGMLVARLRVTRAVIRRWATRGSGAQRKLGERESRENT